jgi:hypothetical protein
MTVRIVSGVLPFKIGAGGIKVPFLFEDTGVLILFGLAT